MDYEKETFTVDGKIVRRPQPLEYLPPLEDDERVVDDDIPVKEDEVVKEDPRISEDQVVGWASAILVDNNEMYSLLDCPDCHATFSSKLSFCPGCGLMVSPSLRSR